MSPAVRQRSDLLGTTTAHQYLAASINKSVTDFRWNTVLMFSGIGLLILGSIVAAYLFGYNAQRPTDGNDLIFYKHSIFFQHKTRCFFEVLKHNTH